MYKLSWIFPLFFCQLIFTSLAIGQEIPFAKSDFTTTGDAVNLVDHCFRLTTDDLWQGGALWYKNAIDLNEPFEMEIDVQFGCYDFEGADGIVFIFHPELTTGFPGEGMGFGRLFPSFGIEMDTYENMHLDDPVYDHVAFMKHGRLGHFSGITTPKPLLEDKSNVEDCQVHRIKIIWAPSANKVSFYFDGALRMSKNIDLVKEIFYGNSMVYWGLSSATGGKSNEHRVCLEKMKFSPIIGLDPLAMRSILNGETYTFQQLQFQSGGAVLPKEATKEIDAIIPILQKEKGKAIILDGYTDNVGDEKKNAHLSLLRAKAVADYLKQKGIAPHRVIYNGFGEKSPIAPNNEAEGRLKNRRVELRLQHIKA